MPPALIIIVSLMTPGYMDPLWTTPMGNLIFAGSAIWMLIGILVMRKMINFDF
jgi:tight adherence protein B